MADIKYENVEELGVLSENAKGWRKERAVKFNIDSNISLFETLE